MPKNYALPAMFWKFEYFVFRIQLQIGKPQTEMFFEGFSHQTVQSNYSCLQATIQFCKLHIINRAKEFGVNGYLLKNSSREELLMAIELVMNNHTAFPYHPPLEKSQFDETDSFLKQFNLTKRELEIIQLLKEGYTNQQLADRLYLSVFTVETHRKNIMKKLELKTPAELMKFIYQHQL